MTKVDPENRDAPLVASSIVLWLVVGCVGSLFVGQWLGTWLWVEPTCVERCESAGSAYASLWIGGRGRGESACVCADDSRIPLPLETMMNAAVAASLVIVYAPLALYAARRRKRRP